MARRSRLERAALRLYEVYRGHRRLATLATYAAIIAGAYALAYLIRFDFAWPAEHVGTFLLTLPLLLAVRLGCHTLLRVSMERWRFAGPHDVVQLGLAIGTGTLLFFLAVSLLPLAPAVPRSVIVLEALLTLMLTAGLWLAYRIAWEHRRRRATSNGDARRVLIVGAGEAGNRLVKEIWTSKADYEAVGFLDDDPLMWGSRIQRLEVIGSTVDAAAIARAVKADEILIAVPSAAPVEMRRIVRHCEETGLPFRVLPGVAEVIDGDGALAHLREVRVEDLLGREPVTLELPELAEDLRGERVLITGAAGSIGSELSRQVALHRPARLVLLDQSETGLFYLEMELRDRYPDQDLVAVVGDVVDRPLVESVFTDERPSRVYHAAAYKHVPLMEANRRAAVRNNVIGTWRIAEAAGRHGADRFVLVSTDKAVSPRNVMGATKRLAELVVTELQDEHPDTTYSAVRFGNVLASAGSVIPIFQRQLAEGRSLTVTHRDATRYFMTIPEAVQLILQASLLPAVRGRIAMLDMGEPVKIADLARTMIGLARARGLHGAGIEYTGLRPGEKLHEELTSSEEATVGTEIEKVRIITGNGKGSGNGNGTRGGILARIPSWEASLESRGEEVLAALGEMFPGVTGTGGKVTERMQEPVKQNA